MKETAPRACMQWKLGIQHIVKPIAKMNSFHQPSMTRTEQATEAMNAGSNGDVRNGNEGTGNGGNGSSGDDDTSSGGNADSRGTSGRPVGTAKPERQTRRKQRKNEKK
jgi:hypothetical protein